MIARIAIDGAAAGRLFDYAIPEALAERAVVGARVRVQFGRRDLGGVLVELVEESEYLKDRPAAPKPSAAQLSLDFGETPEAPAAPRLKPLLGVEDGEPALLPALVRLARWMATYYYAPIERCLQTLLPAPVRGDRVRERVLLYVDPVELPPDATPPSLTARQRELLDNLVRVGGGWLQQVCTEFGCSPPTLRKLAEAGVVTIEERARRRDPLANRKVVATRPLALNEDQTAALSLIRAAVETPRGEGDPPPKPVLLFGVTGSGKTEVYLQAIAAVLARGEGAIVLVPEISLTPQTVQRFAGRFGDQIAVLHSALGDGERYDEWQRIRRGEARVVVGPRSAVFAPVGRLGLIVVDEEHEPSYKQEESPRYNARDVAVMRAHIEHCAVVLGSATPSLESWRNAQTGKYGFARLSRRAVADATMPHVHIVDMRQEFLKTGRAQFFSKDLLDAIHLRLERGEQTMLFLNRRGYATSLVCPTCGYVATCQACDLPFTYHRADDCLRCHVCGAWQRPGDRCPQCGDPRFKYAGFGTQRVEDIVAKCFPSARVGRMDADSTSRKMGHDEILAAFRAKRIDILIGTQMIAKGLDFPNVTLVGIVMADISLHMPDIRAGERTFQLLAQVAGRTGRGEMPGEVFVQTYTPEHPAIQTARTENFEGFAALELPIRKEGGYPPYLHLACVTVSGPAEEAVADYAARFAADLKASGAEGLLVSEACPASLAKAKNQYRYQVLLRAPSAARMLPAIRHAESSVRLPGDFRVAIDIDAMTT